MNKVDAWQKDIFAKCKLMRPLYTPIIGVDELDGKKLIHHHLVSGRRFASVFLPEDDGEE